MSAANTFEDFLVTQAPQIDLSRFLIDLGVAGLISAVMAILYARWGRGQSHRTLFAANFFFISMTTLIVITVVKSSLALSLGLVGALSVIRFRTAIKDPEELSFLFLAIAVGLGLGADQRGVTVIGVTAIMAVYAILKVRVIRPSRPNSMYIHFSHLEKTKLESIESILLKKTQRAKLKRASDSDAVFLIEVKSTQALDELSSEIKIAFPTARILVTEYQELT